MRVRLTPTVTQTSREISPPQGLGDEWNVTFHIEGEGIGTVISFVIPADTAIEARAQALAKLQRFQNAASLAAD